ncbi:hypothetical protein DH2020_022331 [Rehmannia glutinosa]|uniref:Uncharacterized protein n=1 Tax=Rehmannia glutinosa TaxID=99300 RepID=A0ABR0WFB5_REHGL
MIAGGPTNGDSQRARKRYARAYKPEAVRGHQVNTIQGPSITFDQTDLQGLDLEHNDPMVITMDVANFAVRKVLVDSGSSVDVIALSVLRKMDLGITSIKPVVTSLTGFGGHESEVKRATPEPIRQVCVGEPSSSKKSKSEDYRMEPVEEYLVVQLDPDDTTKTTRIGSQMTPTQELMMIEFKKNYDVFAWEPRTGRSRPGGHCSSP